MLIGILVVALVWSGVGAKSAGHNTSRVRGNRARLRMTYAETPLGNWFQDLLDTQRNNYDRFAHFVQGFVPAILVRELPLRLTPLRPGGWTFTLTTAVCLSIAACFEFVEWAAAVILDAAADDFLGTQGDMWDTRWDMFLCLCGALVAQVLLRRVHDHQLMRGL